MNGGWQVAATAGIAQSNRFAYQPCLGGGRMIRWQGTLLLGEESVFHVTRV